MEQVIDFRQAIKLFKAIKLTRSQYYNSIEISLASITCFLKISSRYLCKIVIMRIIDVAISIEVFKLFALSINVVSLCFLVVDNNFIGPRLTILQNALFRHNTFRRQTDDRQTDCTTSGTVSTVG